MTAGSPNIMDSPAASLCSAFTDAMCRIPTAVSVITTDGPAGRFGVTVSAVTSVSADPRMLLICINRRSPACAAIRENRIFTVNFLSESQSHVADCFAGRPAPDTGPAFTFDLAAWTLNQAGLPPHLEDAAAAFHCSVEQAHDAGTHTVLIGRVMEAVSGEAPPLAYVHRDYAGITRLNQPPAANSNI
jgi:flavin reductase (DIM6/NTAB) family NADH-FMN oxidoreductase RutF